MSGRRGPSEGTKVTQGKDAPIYQEAAGLVPDESLAAESYRSGGEFASNRGAEPTGTPNNTYTEVGSAGSPSGAKTGSGGGGGTRSGALPAGRPAGAEPQGGAAPTYVNAQFARDEAGPRGKNLREVDHFGAGARPGNSLAAEPGSVWDPARAAEQQLRLSRTHGGGAGPRQRGVEGDQPFGALDEETSS